MCELFAISSHVPTSIGFSLERLAQHGEDNGPRDGWGVAFYEEKDVSLFREPEPASGSALIQFIEQHSTPSSLAISHIRKATHGNRSLANTHPFMRELAGRRHVFAHNGAFAEIDKNPGFTLGNYHPVGETDSELAFCFLLNRLEDLWESCKGELPTLTKRLDIISDFAAGLRALGPANFLYSDADVLFAHADRRHQQDGHISAPGLHILSRNCRNDRLTLANGGVTIAPQHQNIVMVASVPLTDEPWHPLAEGEIIAISGGKILENRLG